MNRPTLSVFDSPFLLGFDHIQTMVEDAARAAEGGYPPYNVEALKDGALIISIAVAGFSEAELDVLVEGGTLTVRGEKSAQTDGERNYLHRGIAARRFQRAFVLEGGMVVDGAELSNGVLNIHVSRPEPDHRVRRIEIKGDGK